MMNSDFPRSLVATLSRLLQVIRILHNICAVFSGAGIKDPGMNGEMVSPGEAESVEFALTLKPWIPAEMAWSFN